MALKLPVKNFTIWVRHDTKMLPCDQAVPYYAILILSRGYPAPASQAKGYADNEAVKKYGPGLYETIYNIYKECHYSMQDAEVHVEWQQDGSPRLKVMSRKLILLPSSN